MKYIATTDKIINTTGSKIIKNETLRLGKSVETVVTRISSGSFSGITFYVPTLQISVLR